MKGRVYTSHARRDRPKVAGLLIGDDVRAARILLKWSQATLAGIARVPVSSVQDIEQDRAVRDLRAQAVRSALEAAGASFAAGEGSSNDAQNVRRYSLKGEPQRRAAHWAAVAETFRADRLKAARDHLRKAQATVDRHDARVEPIAERMPMRNRVEMRPAKDAQSPN